MPVGIEKSTVRTGSLLIVKMDTMRDKVKEGEKRSSGERSQTQPSCHAHVGFLCLIPAFRGTRRLPDAN